MGGAFAGRNAPPGRRASRVIRGDPLPADAETDAVDGVLAAQEIQHSEAGVVRGLHCLVRVGPLPGGSFHGGRDPQGHVRSPPLSVQRFTLRDTEPAASAAAAELFVR